MHVETYLLNIIVARIGPILQAMSSGEEAEHHLKGLVCSLGFSISLRVTCSAFDSVSPKLFMNGFPELRQKPRILIKDDRPW